jgi:hypothetical protein
MSGKTVAYMQSPGMQQEETRAGGQEASATETERKLAL